MNERFWISDTHWFHKRILELTNRPFETLEEMNEALVKNWNERVTKSDIVYHLGDFSFGTRAQTEELIGRLRGQIHLIRGNHDEVLDKFRDRFASYQDYKEIRIDGRKIVMCHYPLESWHGAHRDAWHLHGHCHGTLERVMGNRLDVGIDNVGPRPINLEELTELMDQLPQWVPTDHHDPATITNTVAGYR